MSKMTTGLQDNGTTGLRKVSWSRGQWSVVFSVVCGLVVSWSVVAQPLPQDVPTIKTYQTAEMVKGAARQLSLIKLAVVVPPKTITLHWIQPDYDGEGWVWELYEYNPQTGRSTFRGMTSDTNYQVIATGDYQFFTVRAIHLGVKGEPVK